jgi:hypothetical protein
MDRLLEQIAITNPAEGAAHAVLNYRHCASRWIDVRVTRLRRKVEIDPRIPRRCAPCAGRLVPPRKLIHQLNERPSACRM